MKKLFAFLILTISYLLITANVAAQYGQPSTSYSITIDKYVGYPYPTDKGGNITCDWSVEYSENYLPADLSRRFKPGQYVCFQLKVKNTSLNTGLANVQVKDTFPSYITPVAGPGSFDNSSKTISFNAGDFAQNEEKVYFIKAQISDVNQLPSDKGLFCLTNKAEVWGSNNTYDDDFAQFCIEKQVTGVATTPSAGPEMGILLLAGESTLLGIGIYLKNRFAY